MRFKNASTFFLDWQVHADVACNSVFILLAGNGTYLFSAHDQHLSPRMREVLKKNPDWQMHHRGW